MVRLLPWRPFLGGPARPGRKIRPPHRGTGRSPGDPAVHQPGARRHHHDARPVRGVAFDANPVLIQVPRDGDGVPRNRPEGLMTPTARGLSPRWGLVTITRAKAS